MKKLLLLFVMILLPMVASADAVEIDGIYYNLIPKGNVAEVTSNPNKYSGNVVIPSTIIYEGETYSITSIGENAFSSSTGLTSVTIPSTVLTIKEYAFQLCTNLTSITIPNSVTEIKGNAFWYCYGLVSITIPNSVETIGWGAFASCTALTSVTISNRLKIIDGATFSGCTKLASIIIPNSVTSIGLWAFKGCSSLKSVTLSDNISNISAQAFMECSSITSLSIPNSITNIGNSAFKGCSNLASVSIGSGDGKIKIDEDAFGSCRELKEVFCHAINVPNTDINAFKNSYIEYVTLHVPAESVNAYKAKEPWKNFNEIVSIEGGGTPDPQKCEKPNISYNNGQLKFASATDGAEFVSEITDSDIKKNYEATVTLTATYNISVYATKAGYDNSETATATLCWIDKEPTTEGITDGVAQIPSKAVLIQSEGGILKVEGVEDGTQVAVYTPDGKQAGSAVCRNGAALVGTNIQPGNTAIVKIGEKTVKVIIK